MQVRVHIITCFNNNDDEPKVYVYGTREEARDKFNKIRENYIAEFEDEYGEGAPQILEYIEQRDDYLIIKDCDIHSGKEYIEIMYQDINIPDERQEEIKEMTDSQKMTVQEEAAKMFKEAGL